MIRFFERQIEALGSTSFALSFQNLFKVLVTHLAPEVDNACETFAKTLRWPELSEQVRFGVCLRLECARKYCENAAKEEWHDEPQAERQDKFLREMLIRYWYEAGREEWFMEVVCPVNHNAYLRLVEESMQRRMER
jgi:hypothetical protein